MATRVLCLNAGSASLKCALWHDGELTRRESCRLEDLLPDADAVGHRVVHGGARYSAPALVDPALLADLHRLIPFAPLHLPPAIRLMERVFALRPELPQVACFDTAFHRNIPSVARRFAIPLEWAIRGVVRYGFHGLSFESILAELGAACPLRLIIAHLGGGSSLAAVRDGQPIDTTMGLTPLGGVPMGTRPGDLDPGVLLYLMREGGVPLDRLETMLNLESGLKGLSGISGDIRELAASPDPRAQAAVESFCYGVTKAIGSLAAALGGLDMLVFTGGIGENSAHVRDRIRRPLEFLNAEVRVIPSNEEEMVARHTLDLVGG